MKHPLKTIIATAAIVAAIATSAHADTYAYICRGRDYKAYFVKIDTDSSTLTWRGTTFRNLQQVEGCKAKYLATLNGASAELCTATQGAADLTIRLPKHAVARFDCEMVR